MRHFFLVVAVTASCAPLRTEQPRNPRGLRADQHLAAAREHEHHADELTRWPDPRQAASGDPTLAQQGGRWYRTWDTSQDSRLLAAAHYSAAAKLEADFETACSTVPEADIRVSPFQRDGIGGIPTSDGVIVLLRPTAGPPARVIAQMRCHRAWMMLQDGAADGPLDLAGLEIAATGDASGISVALMVRDRKLVPELQRRAARDLEAATRRAHPRRAGAFDAPIFHDE